MLLNYHGYDKWRGSVSSRPLLSSWAPRRRVQITMFIGNVVNQLLNSSKAYIMLHHVTSTFGKSPFFYFWSGILHLGLKNIWIYDINRNSFFYGKQLLVILGMVKYVVSVSMDIRQIANVCCISCQCLRLQRWPWPWPVCVRVLPPAYPPVITRGR